MLSDLDLYRRLISLRIRTQMYDRASFLFDLFTTALVNGIFILTIALVFEKFGNVGGWRLAEVAFLYGMVDTAYALADMIFSGFDPLLFGAQVRLGRFDQLLLRPVDITLQVLGSEFLLRRLGRVGQGLLVLFLALGTAGIHWTPAKVLYLPVILLSLVCFFGGLFIAGAALTFFTYEGIEAVNILTSGGTEMMAYPMHIYPDWMRRFFTFVVPAMFLNYTPALYILDKPDPLGLPSFTPFLSPLVGLGVLAAGLAFWQVGIRGYQSTGT